MEKRPKITYNGLGRTRRIHLVGIGGAGMSAIAEVLLRRGYAVSGSDQTESDVTERLKLLGATIYIGHAAEHIGNADVVAHSSAVKPNDNIEAQEALRKNIPLVKRDELLGELMRHKTGICIAGTHGKTTTTTMVGTLLQESGLNPTVLIGGVSDYFMNLSMAQVSSQGSAVVGESDFMVIEADEYDRTFLKLTPTIAVITTLEAEHLDIYKNLDDVKEAFIEFANKVPFYGAVICCGDEPNINAVLPQFSRKAIRYGVNPDNELQAVEVQSSGVCSTFSVTFKNVRLGELTIHAPGSHNVKNALAATAVGLELGLDFKSIQDGLAVFRPVRRRFQIKHNDSDTILVDDYAHHPTEVRATLQAARNGWKQHKLVAVFQPHLYSRTKDFTTEFADALSIADEIFVMEIYPSREKQTDFPAVSSALLMEALKKLGHRAARLVADKNMLVDEVMKTAQPKTLVVTMGAGDVTKYADKIATELNRQTVQK